MYINRHKEFIIKQDYHEAWSISLKYSKILIEHEKNNEYFNLAENIYHQYISELKLKKLDFTKKKNYVQIWNTMINTINHNEKINVCRSAIKLLHQTNVQRCN